MLNIVDHFFPVVFSRQKIARGKRSRIRNHTLLTFSCWVETRHMYLLIINDLLNTK